MPGLKSCQNKKAHPCYIFLCLFVIFIVPFVVHSHIRFRSHAGLMRNAEAKAR